MGILEIKQKILSEIEKITGFEWIASGAYIGLSMYAQIEVADGFALLNFRLSDHTSGACEVQPHIDARFQAIVNDDGEVDYQATAEAACEALRAEIERADAIELARKVSRDYGQVMKAEEIQQLFINLQNRMK